MTSRRPTAAVRAPDRKKSGRRGSSKHWAALLDVDLDEISDGIDFSYLRDNCTHVDSNTTVTEIHDSVVKTIDWAVATDAWRFLVEFFTQIEDSSLKRLVVDRLTDSPQTNKMSVFIDKLFECTSTRRGFPFLSAGELFGFILASRRVCADTKLELAKKLIIKVTDEALDRNRNPVDNDVYSIFEITMIVLANVAGESSKASEVSNAADVPQVSETSKGTETPETSNVSESPKATEVLEAIEAQRGSENSKAKDASGTPAASVAFLASEAPKAVDASDAPKTSETLGLSESMNAIGHISKASDTPKATDALNTSEILASSIRLRSSDEHVDIIQQLLQDQHRMCELFGLLWASHCSRWDVAGDARRYRPVFGEAALILFRNAMCSGAFQYAGWVLQSCLEMPNNAATSGKNLIPLPRIGGCFLKMFYHGKSHWTQCLESCGQMELYGAGALIALWSKDLKAAKSMALKEKDDVVFLRFLKELMDRFLWRLVLELVTSPVREASQHVLQAVLARAAADCLTPGARFVLEKLVIRCRDKAFLGSVVLSRVIWYCESQLFCSIVDKDPVYLSRVVGGSVISVIVRFLVGYNAYVRRIPAAVKKRKAYLAMLMKCVEAGLTTVEPMLTPANTYYPPRSTTHVRAGSRKVTIVTADWAQASLSDSLRSSLSRTSNLGHSDVSNPTHSKGHSPHSADPNPVQSGMPNPVLTASEFIPAQMAHSMLVAAPRNGSGDSVQATDFEIMHPATPMQTAAESGDVTLVELLYAAGATSNAELHTLSKNEGLRISLWLKGQMSVMDYIDRTAGNPRRLKDLCRLTVSRHIGCRADRKHRALSLGLPLHLVRYLLFYDVLVLDSSDLHQAEKA